MSSSQDKIELQPLENLSMSEDEWSKSVEPDPSLVNSINSLEKIKSISKNNDRNEPEVDHTISVLRDEHQLTLSGESEHPSKTNYVPKSVSFMVDEEFLVEDENSPTKSPESLVFKKNISGSWYSKTNSLDKPSFVVSTGTSQIEMPCKKSTSTVLENIPEVDENNSNKGEIPGYYGWDGYEAKFEDSIQSTESTESIPKCIPPWAKSMRKAYGLPSLESLDNHEKVQESRRVMQEKIENLMKKHKDLTLLKRVESRKQLIVEPSKIPDELDTVKMRTKNTKYYVTPLTVGDVKSSSESQIGLNQEVNQEIPMSSLNSCDSMSVSKKTSEPQAKKEILSVLKALGKSTKKKTEDSKEYRHVKKESIKCPKITLSKIREFVNMDPDERKLHEIIKIQKVPSVQGIDQVRQKTSQYIINVPYNDTTDKQAINVIKIKEKRKLKINSIENIQEKVTELRYNEGKLRTPDIRDTDYIYEKRSSAQSSKSHIKKKYKSPTETKTFEITTKKTPVLTPLIDDTAKKTDKVLLIQYENKSKSNQHSDSEQKSAIHTAQLLGIKGPCKEEKREMYVYDFEDDGKKTKEHAKKIEDIPPSLKDKVNLIFKELRDITFQQEQPRPDFKKSTTNVDHTWPKFKVATNVGVVQAVAEVKSAEVQVNESRSLLPEAEGSSAMLVAPHPTLTSVFEPSSFEKRLSILDDSKLKDKLAELVPDTTEENKIPTIDSVGENESDNKKLKKQYTDEKKIESQPKHDVDLLLKEENIHKISLTGTKLPHEEIPDKSNKIPKESIEKKHLKEKLPEKLHELKDKSEEAEYVDLFLPNETETNKLPNETELNKKARQNIEADYSSSFKGEDYRIQKISDEKTNTEIVTIKSKTSKETIKSKTHLEEVNLTLKTNTDSKAPPNVTNTDSKAPLNVTNTDSKAPSKDTKTLSQESTRSLRQPLIKHEGGGLNLSDKSKEKYDQKIEIQVSQSYDEVNDVYFKRDWPEINEDIRSYDLSPEQYQEFQSKNPVISSPLLPKSSSKFLHKKDALRKRMNWTDDTIYLENNLCPTLKRGLAATAIQRPADPIAYLAHFIYKEYENRERREFEEVRHEHLELAKSMAEVTGNKPTQIKFNVRKYPIVKSIQENNEDLIRASGDA